MTNGADYLSAKRLLAHFEALEKNPAFTEIKAEIQREHANCIKGLRNRQITVDKRQEFQEGADLTERLLAFVDQRLVALRRDTTVPPDQLGDLSEN